MTIQRNRLLVLLLLWGLLFLTCLSLGYPTLNRYTPSQPQLSDSEYYAPLVEKGFSEEIDQFWRYRVLVPYVAKPFYWLGQGRIGTWNPVYFGLLIANSIFISLAALFLLFITELIVDNIKIGFITSLIFLTHFNTTNFYLSGLVDSAEVFLVVFTAWLLLSNRWFILPVVGVLAALTKATAIAFPVILSCGWYAWQWMEQGWRWKPVLIIACLVVVSFSTLSVLHSAFAPGIVWPWEIVAGKAAPVASDVISRLIGFATSRSVYYTFIWLLPLGLLGIRAMPKPWIAGSVLSFVVAALLAAMIPTGQNVSRPLFTAIGPILLVAAAVFLSNCMEKVCRSKMNSDTPKYRQ